MEGRELTSEQIRRKGIKILAKNLGPVDMVRFLQQFDLGTGDYSRDRHAWLDELTIEEIAKGLRRRETDSWLLGNRLYRLQTLHAATTRPSELDQGDPGRESNASMEAP